MAACTLAPEARQSSCSTSGMGSESNGSLRRASKLRLYQGAEDKLAELERRCDRLKIPTAACACVGDDLPDIPVMRKVALAFAVADAHPEARHAAHLITKLPGGHGAVREVCDYLLAHGHGGRRTRKR